MESRETNQREPLTLGSLFDGSGGFPLAGNPRGCGTGLGFRNRTLRHPGDPQKRLPKMQHYGGVSGISGTDLEPVDIITFGSPCQDLSIAGKRSGLDGSRSGLFYEAIRIVKEMREKNAWRKTKIYCLGKRTGGLLLQQRGGLQSRPRRSHPDQRTASATAASA